MRKSAMDLAALLINSWHDCLSLLALREQKCVIKFGTTRSTSARFRYRDYGKTFTPAPNHRMMTKAKEEQIIALLQEQVSQRDIKCVQGGR